MGFLGFGNYNKPGPGIEKDAPKKKGFDLMFEILGREFWQIWALNFYFLIASIPIITIGPATVAMHRVLVTMIRDENVYALRDFITAFKKNFKQGVIVGIPMVIFFIFGIVLNIGALANIEIAAVTESFGGMISSVLIFLWTVLVVSLYVYILPSIAYVDLTLLSQIKNSVLLMFLGHIRTLGAVAITVAALVAALYYFPISILPVLFAGFFALIAFFTNFLVWSVIERYVLGVKNQEETEDDSEETEENYTEYLPEDDDTDVDEDEEDIDSLPKDAQTSYKFKDEVDNNELN